MPPRTVALIGAVCLTSGWLLASMMTPPVANLQALPERRAIPTPVDETVAPFSEQLHFRLRQAPAPPVPRRNPFAFASRARTASVSAARSDAQTAVEPLAPITPAIVGPNFTLSGIGMSATAEGTVLTAVLSDGTTVHLVKAGATIGGYQVVEITEASVTLADSSGARYVLRLKH